MTAIRMYAAALLSVLSVACGGGPDEGPLVEVADRGIDAEDLRGYREQLPEKYMPQTDGVEAVRELLRALVDRQIMVLEAEHLGYHQKPEFAARRHRLTTERLVDAVQHDEFGEALLVTEDDVRKIYEEEHWNRRILPAHIVADSEAEAREIVRLLDEGHDFHELARERSRADDAEGGGFLDQYFSPGDAMSLLVERVYGMPVGSYTREPVQTRDGWEVVKILDEEEVHLEQVRQKLTRAAHRGKFFAQRKQFVERLRDKLQATEAAADGPTKSDTLLVAEARARGMDRSPDFLRFQHSLYERMLVTLLRREQVLNKILVTDVDVAAAYEKERADFRLPGRVEGTRVLVRSEQQGRDLAERIRSGADPEELAREQGLLLGHIHISDTDPAYDRFRNTAIGDVIGPVEVESEFEILHIDALTAPRMRNLDEVAHIVRHKIRLRSINRSFETYVDDLRHSYSKRIVWHDDRIGRLVNQVR